MARVVDETRSLFVDDEDDDIIEVQVNPRSRPANSLEGFLLNMPSGRSSGRPSRTPSVPLARDARRHSRRVPARRGEQNPSHNHRPHQPATFIDLTADEDESEPRAQSQSQGGRNPRRTASQMSTPPRLARSDSTFMAPPPANFIDLTESPDDVVALDPMQGPPGLRYAPRRREMDRLVQVEMREEQPQQQQQHQHPRLPPMVPGFGAIAGRLAGILGAANYVRAEGMPMVAQNAWRMPHLDVSINPFHQPRQPSPKAPAEPPPPTRKGFTRDTRAESEDGADRVVICPACHEELAYDPAGPPVQAPTTASGRKRKRAPGEHHFWAVKKCGHVRAPTMIMTVRDSLTDCDARYIAPTALRTANLQRPSPTAWAFPVRTGDGPSRLPLTSGARSLAATPMWPTRRSGWASSCEGPCSKGYIYGFIFPTMERRSGGRWHGNGSGAGSTVFFGVRVHTMVI